MFLFHKIIICMIRNRNQVSQITDPTSVHFYQAFSKAQENELGKS